MTPPAAKRYKLLFPLYYTAVVNAAVMTFSFSIFVVDKWVIALPTHLSISNGIEVAVIVM